MKVICGWDPANLEVHLPSAFIFKIVSKYFLIGNLCNECWLMKVGIFILDESEFAL